MIHLRCWPTLPWSHWARSWPKITPVGQTPMPSRCTPLSAWPAPSRTFSPIYWPCGDRLVVADTHTDQVRWQRTTGGPDRTGIALDLLAARAGIRRDRLDHGDRRYSGGERPSDLLSGRVLADLPTRWAGWRVMMIGVHRLLAVGSACRAEGWKCRFVSASALGAPVRRDGQGCPGVLSGWVADADPEAGVPGGCGVEGLGDGVDEVAAGGLAHEADGG